MIPPDSFKGGSSLSTPRTVSALAVAQSARRQGALRGPAIPFSAAGDFHAAKVALGQPGRSVAFSCKYRDCTPAMASGTWPTLRHFGPGLGQAQVVTGSA